MSTNSFDLSSNRWEKVERHGPTIGRRHVRRPPYGLTVRLAVSLLSLFLASTAAAQQAMTAAPSTPVAQGVRVENAPTIDGVLDDAAWSGASTISDFIQHEPFEGQRATEPTEIRIVYDDAAIYVGARMRDSNANGIVFGENRRDANLRDADALLIVFDTFFDRQNAYVFGTTPAGIEYDGQVTRDGQGGISTSRRIQTGAGSAGGFSLNWDGSWSVATVVDETGWYAEFRIPFSTIRYQGSGRQTWGLNISRTVRRTNEEVFWAPVPRQYDLYRVSEAGTLEGISTPGKRSIRLTPYALSSAHRDFDNTTSTNWSADFGADAKVGITPSLNLDLTYNTDFAQVEADEQQVNLTRFSLFFPEKRPFFLENAGTFSVGTPASGSDLGMDLFFSRRIGIGEDGQPVPILGGGRLTGKVGGTTVGLLNLQTESVSTEGIPSNNFAVGRVLKELPNRTQLGAFVASRLNTDDVDDYNLTYAVDGRLGIGERINFAGYVARTATPLLEGREHGIGFTGGYQTREWDFGVQYREVGEDFNPEIGFLPRNDYRLVIGRVQRNIRIPSALWLRELRPHILVRDFFGFDGFNQTRYIHIDNGIAFDNGAFLSTAVNLRREGLQQPFEISDGVTVPTGTYDFVEPVVRFNTNESASLSFNGTLTLGGFFGGQRKSIAGTITNRIGSTWVAAWRIGYDNVDLPQGAFENFITSLRLAYSFTPRIFLQSLVQYNDQSDNFSINTRFGWLSTAGTGLFIAYNDIQRTIDPTGPQDRTVVIKFTKQFNVIQ